MMTKQPPVPDFGKASVATEAPMEQKEKANEVKEVNKNDLVEKIDLTPSEDIKSEMVDFSGCEDITFAEAKDPKEEEQKELQERLFEETRGAEENENELRGKITVNIPLSNDKKTYDHFLQVKAEAESDSSQFEIQDSDYNVVREAVSQHTNGRELLLEALKTIDDPEHKLTNNVRGITETGGSVKQRYAGQKSVKLSGEAGFTAFSTFAGGLRRIPLWNSGITVTLKPIPLSALGMFYNEINNQDYEYGKEFGLFYYMFADSALTEYIVRNLLPLAISGSNYIHWKDFDRLFQVISFQDYPVLLWAIALMMHPNGVPAKFVCSEPECRSTIDEEIDLSKLRLQNLDLINDQMIEHFSKREWLKDEDLVKYRKACDFDRSFEIESTNDTGEEVIWKFAIRQPSLSDMVAAGKDFLGELRKKVSLSSRQDIGMYLACASCRTFLPWIDSVTHISGVGNDTQSVTVENTGDKFDTQSMLSALEHMQSKSEEFSKKMRDVILSTKISHIAYYFPKCPHCGTVPEFSYRGYIPYDPAQSFFILTVMKLLQHE